MLIFYHSTMAVGESLDPILNKSLQESCKSIHIYIAEFNVHLNIEIY